MQRLSYPTETVLSNKITKNRIVPSFKDSPRKPLRRRPIGNLFLCAVPILDNCKIWLLGKTVLKADYSYNRFLVKQ